MTTIAGFVNDPNLASLLAAKMLNLWIKINAFRSHPHIAVHAAIVFRVLTDFDMTKKFFDMAERLAEKCNNIEFLAWLHLSSASFVAPWFQKPEQFVPSLKKASDYAKQCGVPLLTDMSHVFLLLFDRDVVFTVPLRQKSTREFVQRSVTPFLNVLIEIAQLYAKGLSSTESNLMLDERLENPYVSADKGLVNCLFRSYQGMLLYPLEQHRKARRILADLEGDPSLDLLIQSIPLLTLAYSSSAVACSTNVLAHPGLAKIVSKGTYFAKKWALHNFPMFGALYLILLANKARVLGSQSLSSDIMQHYLELGGEMPTNGCCLTNSYDPATLYTMGLSILPLDNPWQEYVFMSYLSAANFHLSKGMAGRLMAREYVESALRVFDAMGATRVAHFIRQGNSQYRRLFESSATQSQLRLSLLPGSKEFAETQDMEIEDGSKKRVIMTPFGTKEGK